MLKEAILQKSFTSHVPDENEFKELVKRSVTYIDDAADLPVAAVAYLDQAYNVQGVTYVCEEISAEVVVSSSWRSGKTIEELQEIFDYCGGTFKVISKTEHLGFERGIEISKWLKDNIKPETHGCNYYDFHKYAIIDDDSDMLLNQRFNFFQTKQSS